MRFLRCFFVLLRVEYFLKEFLLLIDLKFLDGIILLLLMLWYNLIICFVSELLNFFVSICWEYVSRLVTDKMLIVRSFLVMLCLIFVKEKKFVIYN